MTENKSGKDLIKEAFELLLTGDQTNMAVAVMLLKKQRIYTTIHQIIQRSVNLYIKFIETYLGLNSSKKKSRNFS